MNGGNRTRGQADGFGLEILEKLKDVKSNVPGVTLLHYVVRARLAQEKDHNFEEPLPLPIPEPADIEAASTINFENISAELERLKTKLRGKNFINVYLSLSLSLSFEILYGSCRFSTLLYRSLYRQV